LRIKLFFDTGDVSLPFISEGTHNQNPKFEINRDPIMMGK